MNITTAAGASDYTQSQLTTQIGSAVAVVARNVQRQEGNDVLKLLDAAAAGRGPTAGVGGTLDVTG